MKPKIWIQLFVLFSTCIYLFFLSANCIVNPVYRYDNTIISKNKRRYTRDFAKQLYDKLKVGRYALVFGTSRSHYIDSEILKEPTLNFHAIYGNPNAVYSVLNQLDKNQIQNITTIYYLIDIHVLDGFGVRDDYGFRYVDLKDRTRDILNGLIFTSRDLKDIVLNQGLILPGDFSYYLTPYGYPSGMPKNNTHGRYWDLKIVDPQNYTPMAIRGIGKIDKFCKKHGINIIYFTPTFPDYALKKVDLDLLFKQWNEILDQGISSFYGLWYIDGISNLLDKDDVYPKFRDYSHLNYNAQKMVFEHYILDPASAYKISNRKELENYIVMIREKASAVRAVR